MTERNAARQEDIHFRVLRLLQESPDMTQRDLADELGISLGKANYCLKALLDRGLITVKRFSAANSKLPYVYLLTPSGIAQKAVIGTRFLRRKMNEYEQLKSEIESLQREMAAPSRKAANGRGAKVAS